MARDWAWFGILVYPIVLSVGACGSGSGAGMQPMEDAGPVFLCPLAAGKSYVSSTFALLPQNDGIDLDGDSVIDNEIGKMPPAARDQVNAGFAGAIQAGEYTLLLHMVDWSDPPTPTDLDVKAHLFSGADADVPEDPSNNLSGDGDFFVNITNFDLNCESKALAGEATLVDRVLTIRRSVWRFPFTTGTGGFELKQAIFVITFAEDYRTLLGRGGGIVPACSFAGFPFPGPTTGTVLDALVNDPIMSSVIALDRDLDGDGLEQIVGDGVTIKECIDGDGVTVIPGRDCPCHPAIVDGYSVGLLAGGVTCNITSVQ